MKAFWRLALWTVIALLLCLPAGFVVTMLLIPLWRWIEATFGIESIGHSGPAGWCFWTVYAVLAATSVTVLGARHLRRLDSNRSPP